MPRYHESKNKLGKSHYDSMDSRKRTEAEDENMIKEDHSAMANLPQSVIMKAYPADPGAAYPHLDDTFRNVDAQNAHDVSKMKKSNNPSKY